MSGRGRTQMSCLIQNLRPLAAFQGKLHPVGEEKFKSSKPLIKKLTWPLAIPRLANASSRYQTHEMKLLVIKMAWFVALFLDGIQLLEETFTINNLILPLSAFPHAFCTQGSLWNRAGRGGALWKEGVTPGLPGILVSLNFQVFSGEASAYSLYFNLNSSNPSYGSSKYYCD